MRFSNSSALKQNMKTKSTLAEWQAARAAAEAVNLTLDIVERQLRGEKVPKDDATTNLFNKWFGKK